MLLSQPRPRELAVLETEHALTKLVSSETGLNRAERENRRMRFGRNELPIAPETPVIVRFLRQFTSPFVFLLLAVAVVALLTGDGKDAIIILFVLLMNAVIGTIYSTRASHAMRALQRESILRTRCYEDGRRTVCDVRELVPGDVVLLSAGDRIPADGRWIHATALQVDESALTGESVPSSKHAEPMPVEPDAIPSDIRNAGYAGTAVVAGTGSLLICAIGIQTEFGSLAEGLAKSRPEAPLITRVRVLSNQILIAVCVVAVVLLVGAIASGQPLIAAIAVVLALVVSAVPEGLPIVLTVVLARGVHAMSRRRAIVRELAAVEALGGVDLIFTDKTGTLTKNQLRLVEAVAAHDGHVKLHFDQDAVPHVSADGPGVRRLAIALAAVADASAWDDGDLVGVDPINRAFTDLPRALGMSAPIRLHDRPFDSDRRSSAAVTDVEGVGEMAFLAGAPEAVFTACGENPSHHAAMLNQMTGNGLRVVALAEASGSELERPDGTWRFLGLVGLRDEPRPEAKDAIAWCHGQHIGVIMVTGDHPETAFAIAKALGIADHRKQVVLGETLKHESPERLRLALDGIRVVARATPDTKLRLIQAARGKGRIIAMTGDGINDAPALQAADVGVAMGKSGTDVAREAASLVLTDDNFATIVAAIQEGRSVVSNVEKVVTYLLSTSVAEIVVIGVWLLVAGASPLLPAQILWLNLVTDGFLDMGLALEPTHGGHAKPPHGRLLAPRSWRRIAFLGTTMGLIGLIAASWASAMDGERLSYAITLLALCVVQWWNAWSARSATKSILHMDPRNNRYLLAATGIVIALTIAAFYTPAIADLLRVMPLPPSVWLWVIPLGAIVVFADEAWKWAHRRAIRA